MSRARKVHFKKSYNDSFAPSSSSGEDSDDSPPRSSTTRATRSARSTSTSTAPSSSPRVRSPSDSDSDGSSDVPRPPPSKRRRRAVIENDSDEQEEDEMEQVSESEEGNAHEEGEVAGSGQQPARSSDEIEGTAGDVVDSEEEGSEVDEPEIDWGEVTEQEVDPVFAVLPPRRISWRYPDVRLSLRHQPDKLVVWIRIQPFRDQGQPYELCPSTQPYILAFDVFGDGVEDVADNHTVGQKIAKYLISAVKKYERGDVRSGITTLDSSTLEAGIRDILGDYIVPGFAPVDSLPNLPSVTRDNTYGMLVTRLPAALGGRRYHIYPDRLDLTKCPDDLAVSTILAAHNDLPCAARVLLHSDDASIRSAAALAVELRTDAEKEDARDHKENLQWIASHEEGKYGSRRDPAYRIKWSTAPPRKTPPHDNLQLTVTLWTGMKLGQKRQWYLPTGDTEAESQEFEDWAQTFEQFIKTKPLPSFEEVAEQVEQQAPFDVNSREQYYNYFESIGWGKSTDPFDYGDDVASRIIRRLANTAIDPGRWGGTAEKLEILVSLRHMVVERIRTKIRILAIDGKQHYVGFDAVTGLPLFRIPTDATLDRDATRKFVAKRGLSLHHYWQTTLAQKSDGQYKLEPNNPLNLVLTTWTYNETVFRWPGGLQELLFLDFGFTSSNAVFIPTTRSEDALRLAVMIRLRVLVEWIYRAWFMCCPLWERARQGAKAVAKMILLMEDVKRILGLELTDPVPELTKMIGTPIEQFDFLQNDDADLNKLSDVKLQGLLESGDPIGAEDPVPRPAHFLRIAYSREEQDLNGAREFCRRFNDECARPRGFYFVTNSDGIFTLTGDVNEDLFTNRLVLRKFYALATTSMYLGAFGSHALVVLAEIAHSHADFVQNAAIGNVESPVGVFMACEVTGQFFSINASKSPLQISFARKEHKDANGDVVEHTSGFTSPSCALSIDELLGSWEASHSNFHLATAFANQMEGPGTAEKMRQRVSACAMNARRFYQRSPAAWLCAETFEADGEEKWRRVKEVLRVDDASFKAVEVIEEDNVDAQEIVGASA